jgi:hypothetical protein
VDFFPAAINDNGVIVGGDEIYSGGTLQNLNNLIPAGSPQISYAVAINDNGQIVATSGGQTLLLTPTDHHGGRWAGNDAHRPRSSASGGAGAAVGDGS